MESRKAAVPKCPDSNCGAFLDPKQPGGYCDACKTAWLRCNCGNAVCPLWRHCCFCNALVAGLEEAFQIAPRTAANDQPADRPSVALGLEEAVSSAPILYAGYLWWLTSAGNFYRIAPPGRSDLIEMLGSEFEEASIALVPGRAVSGRTARTPSGPLTDVDAAQRILFAIAGRRHLILIDPATAGRDNHHAVRKIELPFGLTTIRNPDGLTTIAMEGGVVAILAETSSRSIHLALWNTHLTDEKAWRVFAAPETVAGPLCLRGTFALYGREKLYILREERLEEHPLPSAFESIVPGVETSAWPILNPWGRSPFFTTLDGILIPGQRRSLAGSGSPAAYQFVSLTENFSPRFSAIAIARESMPSELFGEKVLFASSGKLQKLDQISIETLSDDKGLKALPCATSARLSAAYIGTLRALEVRLFPLNPMRFVLDSAGVQPVGLHICHNWLVSTALRTDTFYPVIHAWSLL